MSSQTIDDVKNSRNLANPSSNTNEILTVGDLTSLQISNSTDIKEHSLAQKPKKIMPKFLNKFDNYLLIEKMKIDALLPTKSNETDAGYDLYAYSPEIIPAWGKAVISTQIKILLPTGTYGRISSRSGLSFKHNLEVGAGVIDRGYLGEIKVIIRNFSDTDYQVKSGDRIAQIIVEVYKIIPVKIVGNITDCFNSSRGATGFGSSGQ